MEAVATNRRPQRFGIELDAETTRAIAARGTAAIKAKKAARDAARLANDENGLVDISRIKKLSTDEWDEHYTLKAFPGIWRRFFNSTFRDYTRHYGSIAGQSPQYRTLCWRAAALSTSLAIMEAEHAPAIDRIKFDQRLIDCIGQLQKYTEAEKHETTVIDQTKEKVISMMIAVADHVLDDGAKPALFSALRRVIAGGDLDAARAVSLLAQSAQDGQRIDAINVIDA